MDRSAFIAVAVVLAAIVTALLAWPGAPEAPPIELVGNATRRTVTVHVSGAVTRPGLAILDAEARVADAIVAAGGATADAQLGALNLAAPLGDGARLVVPAANADVDGETDGVVRINSANANDLEQLPGVGPVLAIRIVAYRDENGPFSAVEDLLAVPGIGESKLGALRDTVLVP
jgi:competence protein ComEA